MEDRTKRRQRFVLIILELFTYNVCLFQSPPWRLSSQIARTASFSPFILASSIIKGRLVGSHSAHMRTASCALFYIMTPAFSCWCWHLPSWKDLPLLVPGQNQQWDTVAQPLGEGNRKAEPLHKYLGGILQNGLSGDKCFTFKKYFTEAFK